MGGMPAQAGTQNEYGRQGLHVFSPPWIEDDEEYDTPRTLKRLRRLRAQKG